jgi:hypothetical protein
MTDWHHDKPGTKPLKIWLVPRWIALIPLTKSEGIGLLLLTFGLILVVIIAAIAKHLWG